VVHRCHTSLGLLALARGDLSEAMRAFRQAVAAIEDMRAPLPEMTSAPHSLRTSSRHIWNWCGCACRREALRGFLSVGLCRASEVTSARRYAERALPIRSQSPDASMLSCYGNFRSSVQG
jgi:hypothetical protein